MKKFVVIIAAVVVIAVIAVVVMKVAASQQVKFEDVKHLVEPQIVELPTCKVMSCKVSGNVPKEMVTPAIKQLFSVRYQAEGIPNSPDFNTIYARWEQSLPENKDSLTAEIALMVPQIFSQLPEIKDKDALKVTITTWEYGTTAQILHVGGYEKEFLTVEKLKDFIAKSGYEIYGPHEEVYLKGPTMFGAGNPEKYLTLIRYRVHKVDENPFVDENNSPTAD